MNRDIDNEIYALWLTKEVRELTSKVSSQKYDLSNASELPASCFLWIGDKAKRKTWHLPYRTGAGVKEAGVYNNAGPVSITVLRAVSEATAPSYPSGPAIPHQIKTKIKKLMKEFNIRDYAGGKSDMKNMKQIDITEASMSGQFKENKVDKSERLISNVAILRESSSNIYIPGTKGTIFTEAFRKQLAAMLNDKKLYTDHASEEYLKEHKGVRSVTHILGFYENARLDEEGVVRADIRYLSNQANWLEPLIDEMSDKVGLSISAGGKMALNAVTKIAEAIECTGLRSVDLVTEPGSTSNIFESQNDEETIEEENSMDLTKLTMAELAEARPDLVGSIEKNATDEIASKGDIEKQNARIKELEEANKTQAKTIDDYKTVEAVEAKTASINKLLEESKLPKEAISDNFRAQLIEAKDDDAVKAIIEDRKTLLKGKTTKTVTGMGDENLEESDDTIEKDPKKITAKFEEAAQGD